MKVLVTGATGFIGSDAAQRLPARGIEIIEHAPLPPTEPMITYASVGKAVRLLNYQPQTSIEDGLARFYEWYRRVNP